MTGRGRRPAPRPDPARRPRAGQALRVVRRRSGGMVVEIASDEGRLGNGLRPELDRSALQPGERKLVLQPPRRQRRPNGRRLAGQTVIDAEELPAVRAECRRPGAQATAEPGMTAARHRLILAREDDPSERRVRDRQQVEILRHVRLVVAHRAFVGKAQVLGVEQVHPKHRRRHVAHTNAPHPGGQPRVQRERGRDLQHAGHARRPGDSARSDAPERGPGPTTASGTAAPRHRAVPPVPVRMPAHQQPEQAVLGRTRQKLIDQRLPVAQREERACRKELRPQAAGGLEPDQPKPVWSAIGMRVGVSDCAFSERSSPCDSTRWR